jgi:hypothetical protein
MSSLTPGLLKDGGKADLQSYKHSWSNLVPTSQDIVEKWFILGNF